MHRKLRAIWKTIKHAKDETGRLRSPIFMELPSKQEYPDYYLVRYVEIFSHITRRREREREENVDFSAAKTLLTHVLFRFLPN